MRISGHEENAPYGWLQYESGVHRVQRVPVTESKGRMQTSSVAVVLLPVAGEQESSESTWKKRSSVYELSGNHLYNGS